MIVSDVMTWPVTCIPPDASIHEAIKLMLKHDIGGLPVVDNDGKLVGMVTESDFLHRSEIGTERKRSRWLDAFLGPGEAAEAYVHAHGVTVRDVMTHDPVTVSESTPLDEIVDIVERRKIRRLPVTRDGRVIGIISRANLMRALVSLHHMVLGPANDDATIRERILSDIAAQSWAVGAHVDVTVRDGVADLWGTISDKSQRDALRALVGSTPGIERVEEHLTW